MLAEVDSVLCFPSIKSNVQTIRFLVSSSSLIKDCCNFEMFKFEKKISFCVHVESSLISKFGKRSLFHFEKVFECV